MKQGKLANAYDIIEMLMTRPYSDVEAWGLFQVWKKLEPVAEFQKKERQKLIQKYNGKVESTGNVSFSGENNKENAVAYSRELESLESLEIEIDLEPIRLPLLNNFQNCGKYFMILDGIIEFHKPEDAPDISIGPVELVSEDEVPEEART